MDYKQNEKENKINGEKKVEKYQQTKDKLYNVTFKQNRTYELHLRKSVFVFSPNGTLEVNEWFVNHPDFLQQKDKFVITEIK